MSSDASAVSSRSALPPPGDEDAGPLLVRLPATPFVAPPSCACCGEPATAWHALRAGGGREVSIGYCADCWRHVARVATRKLAGSLAAVLIGAALALALPIALPWLSLPLTIGISVAGMLLPLAAVAFRRRAAGGHAAWGPAAWLRTSNELVCIRASWARELARRLGSSAEMTRSSRRPRALEPILAVLVAAIVAPASHAFQHPWVRMLNLGDEPVSVSVDGHALGIVEPSSSESPLAGLEARVPAGRRTFVSRTAGGEPLASDAVQVRAGERHLYAPLGDAVCFWLERATYGRQSENTERLPLGGEERFWVVPEEVQGWFVPNPAPAKDVRATGGTTTVLRQGPCAGGG